MAPPVLVNTVMNSDSPVSRRLPAPSSAPMKPGFCVPLPSPKMVSISMPGVMYIIAAGLGDDALARVELDLDELQILAVDLVGDLVRALPAGRRRRRRGEAAGGRAGQLRHLAERRPLAHPGREDQRRAIDLAGAQPAEDVLLRERTRLLSVQDQKPLLPCRHACLPVSP